MKPPFSFPVILLAAGLSRRMRGRDKLLEPIEDKPLLRLQAEKLRALTSGPLIIALPPPPHPRHWVLGGLKHQPVPVPDAAEGMGASLSRAFAALPAEAPCALLMLADLPDITLGDLHRLAEAADLGSDTQIWRAATEEGNPGHPMLIRADLFEGFTKLTGDDGGRALVAAAQPHVTLVPLPGQRARTDLDSPEDWARWRALRQRG